MNVFDLFAKISLDKSEYEDGLSDAQGKTSSFASAVGNGLKTVGKIGAAAVTAAATGVAALTKMGVEGYAQYEQLVGGVETLFGTGGQSLEEYAASAGKTIQEVAMEYKNLNTAQSDVMANAAEAFKTAGMSANQYMETVTSFSASLISSLDGDTVKAAEVADRAIIAMSDNANKMGTSMEAIQNAYQGFAKQNYTMLDNLKLGYGGTKTEMERLIADANKVREANGEMANLSIDSFADVVVAIETMQDKMGISGTTAREAASTIEGSVAMMKASWENLVVGLADENADIEVLVGDLVDSITTAADNMLPRIEQTLAGIGQLVEGIAPVIATALPAMIESVLPSLLNAAVTLVTTIFGALPGMIESMLPIVIDAAITTVLAFLNVISENFGLFLQIGIDAIIQIVTGIGSALPEIISSAMTIIMELIGTLTNPDNMKKLLDTAVILLQQIVYGLIDALPQLVEAAVLLITNLVDFITRPGNITTLLRMALLLVQKIADGLVDAIPELIDAAIQLIVQLVEYLIAPANMGLLVTTALKIVKAIAEGLMNAAFALIDGAAELIDTLITEFGDTDWGAVGETIIDSLLSGLKDAWESVKTWFGNVWDALFNRSVSVDSDSSGNISVGGYATGLDYVPYDEFPAILHRGEAVLTAAEARDWRKGQKTPAMAGGIQINQYIQSVPQTPVEMAAATEAYFEQARWTL